MTTCIDFSTGVFTFQAAQNMMLNSSQRTHIDPPPGNDSRSCSPLLPPVSAAAFLGRATTEAGADPAAAAPGEPRQRMLCSLLMFTDLVIFPFGPSELLFLPLKSGPRVLGGISTVLSRLHIVVRNAVKDETRFYTSLIKCMHFFVKCPSTQAQRRKTANNLIVCNPFSFLMYGRLTAVIHLL
jgi:hypothetical protein